MFRHFLVRNACHILSPHSFQFVQVGKIRVSNRKAGSGAYLLYLGKLFSKPTFLQFAGRVCKSDKSFRQLNIPSLLQLSSLFLSSQLFNIDTVLWLHSTPPHHRS